MKDFAAFKPDIVVQDARQTVDHDPYLDPFAKSKVNGVLEIADDKRTGLISKHQLTKGALRTGANFLTAYTAGRVLGGILGLPKHQQKTFSKYGGIANAVWNSGLLGD